MGTDIKHLAIIMDGNRRWEKQKELPKYEGYRVGADVIKSVILDVIRLKIPYLTVYAFSSENWQRPIKDVAAIMNIGLDWLKENLSFFRQNGVRCQIIGNRELLPSEVLNAIVEVEDLTAENSVLNFQVAISYGARDEILRACIKFSKFIRSNSGANEMTLQKFLDTNGIPDPDLLIRTGGQKRLSNYMLWQMAYTELCFLDKLWPDFSSQDLCEAVADYEQVQRRFGCV